jgi:predicted SAM-dependent methyltransferase
LENTGDDEVRLLNLACGSVRPQAEIWWNLDNLRTQLAPGTPERAQLDSEPRYVEHDLSSDAELPFEENSFDGVLLSHLVEHFTCWEGVRIMERCGRILKPEGALVVSVPDASYFREVYNEDNIENAVRLFGEPIHLPDGHDTFFKYALWYWQHKVILTEDALWGYFKRAGFDRVFRIDPMELGTNCDSLELKEIHSLLNRRQFSLVMVGIK